MNYSTITWDLDMLATVHAANRDAVVLIIVLKALTDAARRKSRDDVPEVVVTQRRMAMFGLSPHRVRQAVNALQQGGVVLVDASHGKALKLRFDPSFYAEIRTRAKGGWITY